MGKLAQFAILGGKRVPIETLPVVSDKHLGSAFLWRSFERAGIRDIAERVFYCQQLEEGEIARLMEGVTLPVIMKLVELHTGDHDVVEPEPVLCVPYCQWCADYGINEAIEKLPKILSEISYSSCRVVFDRFDLELWTSEFYEKFAQYRREFPHLSFVGPSVEEILECLKKKPDGSSRKDRLQSSGGGSSIFMMRLRAVLKRLKEVGFERLKTSSSSASVRVVSEAGFPVGLRTVLDHFPTNIEFARELLRINRLSGGNQNVQLWLPEVLDTGKYRSREPITDMALLRALAVGTLALSQVPFRRASSKQFSADAFRFARFCGANDFGVGAIDATTAEALNFQSYESLSHARQAITPDITGFS